MILDKFEICKLNAVFKAHRGNICGVLRSTRCKSVKQTVYSARGENYASEKRYALACVGIGNGCTLAFVILNMKRLKHMMRIPLNYTLRLITACRVNQRCHQHFARTAFYKGSALFLLSAKIALNNSVFICLKRNAEVIEIFNYFGSTFTKTLYGAFIGKVYSAADGIFNMIFHRVVLAHCVKAGVYSALSHNRLSAFGLH